MFGAIVSLLCLLAAASVAGGDTPAIAASAAAPVRGLHAGPTDPDRDPVRGSLPFFYDIYTLRGVADSTAVVASFAVPAGELERERDDGGVRYRFDVTLVLADTALQAVSRTDDSVYVAVPRPLPGEHLLYTHVEAQAPPSATTLQRVVMTDAGRPGVGQLYRSAYPIPDYHGTDLMLSDIVMGDDAGEIGWRRGEVTMALLPTSQFPGSSFDVYYEVYNLPGGNAYSTQITIEPVDEEGRRLGADDLPVRTGFAGESSAGEDGTQRELRRIEASLSKGRYRMTVRVRDEVEGRSVRKSRLFEVRGGGRGATMVPALPAARTGPRRDPGVDLER